jgi:hypothetical protein
VFDLQAESWVTGSFPAMSTARSHFGMGVDPDTGMVLVFGGEGTGAGGPPLASVECYDPIAGAWSAKANLPRAVKGALCLREGYHLVLIGGEAFHPTLGTVMTERIRIYEHLSDTWTESKASLPARCRDLYGCTSAVSWTHRGTSQSDTFCLFGGGFDGVNRCTGFYRFYRR